MGKWRDAFAAGLAEEPRTARYQYIFGPPATADELEQVERQLGTPLPGDVRDMLLEFNGVWQQSPGHSPDRLYLTTKDMLVDVPEYLCDSGNPMPAEEQLRKVVFVAQSNGFGALMGVCVESFAEFREGEVVMLDHESGEFTRDHSNLMEFVRHGCRVIGAPDYADYPEWGRKREENTVR